MRRQVSELLARIGIVAALAGCGGGAEDPALPDAGDPAPDAGAVADAAPPDAQTRTITGVWNRRYVTPDGEVVVPDPQIGAVNISALVPPDFTRAYGDWEGDGQFSIANLPADGIYYLNLFRRYFVRTTDTVDLSSDYLGRADAVRATSTTTIAFDVANLSTWQSTDFLELFSADSGTVAYRLERTAVAGRPIPGDTSLSMLTIDLRRAEFPMLIDGDKGDEVTLAQLATTTDGVRSYQTIARRFVPAPFSVSNGATAFVNGAFVDVAQSESFEFSWDVSGFDATIRAAVPAEPLSYPRIGVRVLPEASTRGSYHGAAQVLWYEPGYTGDTSAVAGNWSHGDPYPADWTRIVTAQLFTYRLVSVPGATPMPVYSYLTTELDRDSVTPGSPIVPLVGAVRNLTVNTRDAYGTLDGIGTTPIVAWNPPSIGTADGYAVIVARVFDNAGTTVAQTIAQFDTVDTRVQVPPALLAPDNYYYFHVIARARPGVDVEATPLRESLPSGESHVSSSLATP